MRAADKRRFEHDPFEFLDALRDDRAPAVRLPWGGWCVSDADLAREVLRSPEHNSGRSGFFADLLPTRSDQVRVGHAARDLLREHLPAYRSALTAAVAELPARTRWPDAGTDLLHRCLADVLLRPGSPDRLRELIGRAVHGGVLFRGASAWRRARAEVLRARLLTALAEESARRRAETTAPRDLLDAALRACPPDDRVVAGVYLVLFRSVLAPVSSSLSWALLLGCLHLGPPPWPHPVEHVLREALRHRPMVWMVGRELGGPVEFGGLAFPRGELLSVSPYLLHHDRSGWRDPGEFRPERWADPTGRGLYLPFGLGPFACVGASVAQAMAADALTALTGAGRVGVTGGETRPVMVEGAVPRPFTTHLDRAAARPTTDSEGGGPP
ncbi:MULTISPECIES: cytochrome P450 [Actinosynnema]|uniref:cytochrome P450 n=1 Tax=Actinosynnema TaxID=40566 RepID=UPI0020A46A85|nr:cytochrome P450 [Actinosynnema pretiosum]MCP2096249.1 Cytochrome P450 [Actinosynnema pretiosum]